MPKISYELLNCYSEVLNIADFKKNENQSHQKALEQPEFYLPF